MDVHCSTNAHVVIGRRTKSARTMVGSRIEDLSGGGPETAPSSAIVRIDTVSALHNGDAIRVGSMVLTFRTLVAPGSTKSAG